MPLGERDGIKNALFFVEIVQSPIPCRFSWEDGDHDDDLFVTPHEVELGILLGRSTLDENGSKITFK